MSAHFPSRRLCSAARASQPTFTGTIAGPEARILGTIFQCVRGQSSWALSVSCPPAPCEAGIGRLGERVTGA